MRSDKALPSPAIGSGAHFPRRSATERRRSPRTSVAPAPRHRLAIDWSPSGCGPDARRGSGLPGPLLVAGRRCGGRYPPARPAPHPRPPLRGRARPGGHSGKASTLPSPHVWRRRKEPLRSCMGSSHANHAPAGEKKAEFGAHRPLAIMAADAEQALHVARERLGHKLLPVFVPPWNRISPDLAAAPAALGLCRLVDLHGPEDRLPGGRAAPDQHPCGSHRLAWHAKPGRSRRDRRPASLQRSSGGSRARRTGTSRSAS